MIPEFQAGLSSGAGYALLIWAVGIVAMVAIVVFVIFYPRDRYLKRRWMRDVKRARVRRAREAAQLQAANGIGPGRCQCTSCGKVWDKRGDEDLLVEALATFQALPMTQGPPVVICDDCYRQIMGDDPPRIVSRMEPLP